MRKFKASTAVGAEFLYASSAKAAEKLFKQTNPLMPLLGVKEVEIMY